MFLLYSSLALGGAIGACSRYCVSEWVMRTFPGDISHGTLAVNVIGSLLVGVVFVLIHDKMHLSESVKPFVMTGLLGSFTTFSTFALDSFDLIEDGRIRQAMMYILLSNIFGLLVAWGSYKIGSILFTSTPA